MEKLYKWSLVLGGALRYVLISSYISDILKNRVEVSTPFNSFKRAREGVFLLQHNVNPYEGDVVHEIPIVLYMFHFIDMLGPRFVPLFYILLDTITAISLKHMAKNVIGLRIANQEKEVAKYNRETEPVWWKPEDLNSIPCYVAWTYLFNPLAIASCVGLSSTVLSNCLFALCLYHLSCKQVLPTLFFLAVETLRNNYPFVLIAPVLIFLDKGKLRYHVLVLLQFFGILFLLSWTNYWLTGNMSFINATAGILTYDNLQPNVGLFWYFFTEMFDHFRTMFLITLQVNASFLYLIPLSLKIHKEPFLLATILIALMAVFRAYPSVGDVGFYLALIPLTRRSWKYMAHNFLVFCFFVITLTMMPVLWHLWLYAGSANANFYFGATLAFSTGQIFLVTDLLFAHVKRNFCLFNGEKIYIDGKEAKIKLE